MYIFSCEKEVLLLERKQGVRERWDEETYQHELGEAVDAKRKAIMDTLQGQVLGHKSLVHLKSSKKYPRKKFAII